MPVSDGTGDASGNSDGAGQAQVRTTGNPIPGVVVKGAASLVYEKDLVVKNNALLTYLGARELVIAKGEYVIDHSVEGQARVIVHLQSQPLIHRDLAARCFVFDGTDPNGQTFTYTIEPLYVDGVAKEILVTYKGIQEKGVK